MSWTWLWALGAAAGAAEIFFRTRSDCRIRLAREAARGFTVEYPDKHHACIRFSVPFRNSGAKQGLLVEAQARLQPAGHRFSELQPVCRLMRSEAPRHDGYWEAVIVPAGEELATEVELWLTTRQDARNVVPGLGELYVEFLYKYFSMRPLSYVREELSFDCGALREVPPRPTGVAEVPTPAPAADGPVVPLRTHLLRPGEDVVAVVERYTRDVARPGDLVALAETAVAVMQGRIAYIEDVRPRFLACRLNQFFSPRANMASPYSLEMAFREVGTARILAGILAGAVGKLLGREGDFYRVAGRAVAVIDDCTGTLPPYDKHVVLGPVRMDQLVAEIRERTGLEAAIVDANDLGRVDVLAISDPGRTQQVLEALRPNPQGNAAEMTPLVLIRAAREPAPSSPA
jgi:hypothetical protein